MTRGCRYFSVFQSFLSRNSSLISSSVTQSSKIPQRTERDINDAIQVKNVELNYSLVILHIFSISDFGRNLLSPPSNSSIHKECPSKPVPLNPSSGALLTGRASCEMVPCGSSILSSNRDPGLIPKDMTVAVSSVRATPFRERC